MSKFSTFKRLWQTDKHQILVALYSNIVNTHITDILTDEAFLQLSYRIHFNKNLDLKNPQTFNEKLQWLKLHDRNPEYTMMVDKYEVKKYVADLIGEDYIIPTLGVWDNFNEIDFQKLPNQFVLKCTHDSGGIVCCRDKNTFDIKSAKKKINQSLKRNYYYVGREWPYKDVLRNIIAEPYLVDGTGTELKDYKYMCFNGKIRCCFVCSERFSKDGLKVTFFDNNWNRMPFIRHYPASMVDISKPQNHEKMISLAEKLAQGLPFARIDFYEVNGKTYFGEITLYPGSGFEEFTPSEWDKTLGDWIKLPKAENTK